MIEQFTKAWFRNFSTLHEKFSSKRPEGYLEIVQTVVEMLAKTCGDDYRLDPQRICEINHGGDHGTLVYVIAERGYEPSRYWYVKVSYGSCTGCDTLEYIRQGYDEETRVDQYMALALHIVQGLREMGSSEDL